MNNLEKYKSHIVAKGYSQIAGLDFDETWAPVVRIESVRHLFVLAAFLCLFMLHIDAKSAFLNGESDVELYVQQPEGFVDPRYPYKVLRLNNSLYGLKQASRIWYLLLCDTICSLGFVPSVSDPSIYIHKNLGLIVAVYVDDILVLGDQHKCDQFFTAISQHFLMENKGAVTSFLGLNVQRHGKSISINQVGYIQHVIERFQMTNCKPSKTPLEHSLPLRKGTAMDRRTDQKSYQ